MIELAKHIEVLLLENDCVIVPGLGGFIAHYRPSEYKEDTGTFCPPMRTIGFNPQLVMNDGLLVQSYMQAYNTDFPDATRKIEKTVAALKDVLYQRGQILLNNVGTLYYNMNGVYEFSPSENGFFTPSLYGLESFLPTPLSEVAVVEAPKVIQPEFIKETVSETEDQETSEKIRPLSAYRTWLKTAVAVAAAVLLFFLFSVPVENTYVDEANYASLGTTTLFDAIRNQSAASSVITNTPKKPVKNNVNTLKPVAVRTEKVAPAKSEKAVTATTVAKPAAKSEKPAAKETKPAVPAQTGKKTACSYVIVSSLPNAESAKTEMERMKAKGYSNAEVVEAQGRFRISIAKFSNAADAYKKIQELKKNAEFESAWVVTSK